MIRHALKLACLVLGAVIAVPSSQGAEAGQAPQFSEAETRMWMTDQLSLIDAPTRLVYAFEKSGTFEPGFQDQVTLDVTGINEDGSKSLALEFFTGERNQPRPPMQEVTVNVVLGIYLEGDVYEMNRLTDRDGSASERWRYFQRRIKFALSEDAEVKPVEIDFDGKTYAGHEISFKPYANDPRRNLFERFADKAYTVVVSDELPGYLYRIETVIPSSEAGADPLIREVLELASAAPL